MKKSLTLNTFLEGLVMDINPLVASNDGVCNALNATLVTMNGNENVLQNDMGNARVETAFLPEGYIPLGTTELGGIIYVVSYNPLNKKCQVGSFPSPERNISSDEESDIIASLSNSDFGLVKKEGETETTNVLRYYLKKDLWASKTFNPGDKFIIFGDSISKNFGRLYNEEAYKDIKNNISDLLSHTVKLSLGTITNSGKLVKFSDLKEYTILDEKGSILGKYHIALYLKDLNGIYQRPTVDDYRNLIEQPYNVFNSKISGSLVLITELVLFNNFSAQVHNTFDANSSKKITYNPTVSCLFSNDYPFIPKGIICEIQLVYPDGKEGDKKVFKLEFTNDDLKSGVITNKDYEFNNISLFSNDTSEYLYSILGEAYFDNNERSKYVLKYNIIPCMSWGEVDYLKVSGEIDLSKIGTGHIELTKWKYFNTEKSCSLLWGLEVYELEGILITGVDMEFFYVSEVDKSLELKKLVVNSIVRTISNKLSYFGSFLENIFLGDEFDFKPNSLYLVKISVKDSESKSKTFYRWLYTSTIFNLYYLYVDDFRERSLSFNMAYLLEYNTSYEKYKENTLYGIIKLVEYDLGTIDTENILSEKSSLSAIQTYSNINTSGTLSASLKEDYNMFSISLDKDALSIEHSLNDFSVSVENAYTGINAPTLEEFIKKEGVITENLETFEGYILNNSDGKDVSESIGDTPSGVIFVDNFKYSQNLNDTNVYNINLPCKLLTMAKAYCLKLKLETYFEGRYIPLAYDENTFNKYNFLSPKEYYNVATVWEPNIYGYFGFKELGGKDGLCWIGSWRLDIGESNKYTFLEENNVSFHWIDTPLITTAQKYTGWKGTTMFVIHRWSGAASDYLVYSYNKPANAGDGDIANSLSAAEWNNATRYSYPIDGGDHYHPGGASHSGDNSNPLNACRILLALKSEDSDYYYPINFTCRARILYTSGSNNLNEKPTISSIYSQDIVKDYFMYFLYFLNNIYRYDNSSKILTNIIIPNNEIFWTDSYECRYSTSLVVKLIKEKVPSINITISGESVELSTVADALCGQAEDVDLSNVTYTVADSDTSYVIIILNQDNSGKFLMLYILDQKNTTLLSAVYDYTGERIITLALLGEESVLYLRNGNSIETAKEFKGFEMLYSYNESSGMKNMGPTSKALFYNGIDLNKEFTIRDGVLLLKGTRTSETSFIRHGEHDTGHCDGYLKTTLSEKYKGYE